MSKFTHFLILFFLSGYAFSQERQINTPKKIINRASDINLMQIEQDAMDVDLIEDNGGIIIWPPVIEYTFECEIDELWCTFQVSNNGSGWIDLEGDFIGHDPPGWGYYYFEEFSLYPEAVFALTFPIYGMEPNPSGTYTGTITLTTNEPGNPQYTIVVIYHFTGGIQPIAEFAADQAYIFENDTVTFTDLSENDPASWQWTFQGGIPGSSTEQHPQVVYPYYGTYNVQLKVTNECGHDILFKSGYIQVDFASGNQQPVPVSGINVFPNPSEGIFYIDVPEDQQFSYKVLDLSGTVEINSDWTTNRLIDLSDKSSGLYFLKIIKTDYSSEILKIFVNQ